MKPPLERETQNGVGAGMTLTPLLGSMGSPDRIEWGVICFSGILLRTECSCMSSTGNNRFVPENKEWSAPSEGGGHVRDPPPFGNKK
jgi:hypothetical protein